MSLPIQTINGLTEVRRPTEERAYKRMNGRTDESIKRWID